ncbi:hypothetical protein BJ944DRAFT_270740 [Cunninghamella echinulata]|nr:hypothetical protein BJ944DRAFT_270740 [Cunninghamella echinulata]
MITKYQKTILFILIQLLLRVTSDEVIIDKITKDIYTTNIVTTEYDIKNMNTIIYEDTILDIELINSNDDEDEEDDEEDDDDDQEQDHDDTDDEQQQSLQLEDDEGKLSDDSLNSALYGLLHPQQEIGDDLSEELVEYDDDSNEDTEDETTLLYEDDEAPLDFKNNESIDLDQLLFESSQKDSPLEWDYQPEEGEEEVAQQQDELIEQQNEEYITKETVIEHEEETIIQQDSLFNQLETDYKQDENVVINHDHDNSFIIDNTNNYNDIDQVLASADDALFMDAQDEEEENDHPDHISDDQLNVLIEQQQQQNTMESDDIIHPSNSKMIIFGVLVLLVLLYKNKSIQGYKYKFFAKEDGLPLHNKDIDTPDMTTLLNKRDTNQTQEIYPSPSNSYSYLGRRSSVSSITSVSSISSLNGRHHHHPSSSSSTSSNGHVRKLSSTHHPIITIKESKWEGDWNDKVDKHKE